MIIDRELDQKGTDENIGTSRVNLTQRYVESVKYNGLGDFTEELREEADYRKRIEKIFSEIHMTGETYADLQPEALMEAYWQGEEMISRYYWAKRRDTDDIIWVRVDVRIVPQLDTGDLFAFYNNWVWRFWENSGQIKIRQPFQSSWSPQRPVSWTRSRDWISERMTISRSRLA